MKACPCFEPWHDLWDSERYCFAIFVLLLISHTQSCQRTIKMSRNAQYLLAMAAHARAMTSGAEGVVKRKVAILGAAGGIGQSLSLLMKVSSILIDCARCRTSVSCHNDQTDIKFRDCR